MKRCLFVLLAMLILALPTALVFAAETDLVISFSEPVYNEDGTFTVDLEIENNPGFYYLGVTLDYDHDIFTLVEVSESTSLNLTQGLNLIFSMAGTGNFESTGTLATLTFQAIEDAPHGDHVIGLDDYIECYNYSEDDVAMTYDPCNITFEHNIVHVDAVEATCMNEGNVEYWYCADESCGIVFADEAMTQVTNHMNVKIPVAEHQLVAVEAVAPGCHYTGNVAHWYCTVCDTVWTDEALTQISNHMSVILPELGGEVVHVEATDPTCGVNGYTEHWYCDECEQVWADEARTQLTNRLNVIIPAWVHEFDELGICGLCNGETDLFVSVGIDAESAYFEETFTVDILLDRNHGFAFLSLEVLYDTDAFELVNVTNGDIVDSFEHGKNLVWSCENEVSETGVLATLTFKVKADAKSDDYTVSVLCNEAWGADEQAVTFAAAGNEIKVMKYGDVNGDGLINGKDATRLLQYLAFYDHTTGESTIEVTPGADANADGKVNGKDATRLLQYLAFYDHTTGESSVVLGPAK